MNDVAVLAFFLGLLAYSVYLIIYARKLNSIAHYSNDKQIEVFGTKYRNGYQLYADISFLNSLWDKRCCENIDDEALSSLVTSAHKMLRTGVIALTLLAFTIIGAQLIAIGT